MRDSPKLSREIISDNGISLGWGHPEERRVEVDYSGCKDIVEVSCEKTLMKFLGRILRVSVNLSSVCANRNITVGVILQEKVEMGLLTHGFNVNEVKVQEGCCDPIKIDCLFSIPDTNTWDTRKFQVSIVAHYTSMPMI